MTTASASMIEIRLMDSGSVSDPLSSAVLFPLVLALGLGSSSSVEANGSPSYSSSVRKKLSSSLLYLYSGSLSGSSAFLGSLDEEEDKVSHYKNKNNELK